MLRLKLARERNGLTQKDVSEATDIPLGTLRRWEQGVNEPDAASIVFLADFYGVSTDFILGSTRGNGDAAPETNGRHELPLVRHIATSDLTEAIEQATTSHEVTAPLYEAHRNGFWLQVTGNSMNRLFPDGSLALVDPQLPVRDGDVAAVLIDGDCPTVKRVYMDERDTLTLHPESYDTEYRDRVIDTSGPAATSVRTIGRVVSYTAPDGWRA